MPRPTFLFASRVVDEFFDGFQTQPGISNDDQRALNNRWRLRQRPEIGEKVVLLDGHRGVRRRADASELPKEPQAREDVHVVNGELVIDLLERFQGTEGVDEIILVRVHGSDIVDVQRVHAGAVLQRAEVTDRSDVLLTARATAIVVLRRRLTAHAEAGFQIETGRARGDAFVVLVDDETGASEERPTFFACDTERIRRLQENSHSSSSPFVAPLL